MLKSDAIEIALDTYEDAVATAEILLRNNYVVMLSREEAMFIVNAVFAVYVGDRNDVVFMGREYFDDTYMPLVDEEANNAES